MVLRLTLIELADARRAGLYNISDVPRRSNVSARMIRHYEELHLLKPPRRTSAGHRAYDQRRD